MNYQSDTLFKYFYCATIILVTHSTFSHGDIYKFVDEKGVVYYTNTPTDNRFVWVYKEYYHVDSPTPATSSYESIITDTSKKYEFDPDLVKAVIKAESNFDPFAESRAGALGLMQLMPSTAKEMGVVNVFDPNENIDGGIKYLKQLFDVFSGDLVLSLAAYNAGEGAVRMYDDVPPFKETQEYVDRVLYYYSKFKEENINK